MKKWFLLIAVASLLIGILGAQQKTDTTEAKKEISIRNATDAVVQYSIQTRGSTQDPMRKNIAAGEIDRYPGDTDITCTFSRGGEETTYLLDAGLAFSFRPDENDELELYQGSHGRADAVDLAPYVGTPPPVVRRMLEMAHIRREDILYDLGCGDGRIVIMAARDYGIPGVGIDLDPRRIEESNLNAIAAEVEDLVRFKTADVTKFDFSKATIVTLYLLPESNILMRPLLEDQLQTGATVVSHNYEIVGWEAKLAEEAVMKGDDGGTHRIYVYHR